MNNQPDRPSADDEADDIDRRIRCQLSGGVSRPVPTSIEPRVFTAITRRRRLRRGSLPGLVMGLLVATFLTARSYLTDESADTVVASGDPTGVDFAFASESVDFPEVDPTPLTLPPPVMSFGLLDSSQVALLQGLKSFEGENQ